MLLSSSGLLDPIGLVLADVVNADEQCAVVGMMIVRAIVTDFPHL